MRQRRADPACTQVRCDERRWGGRHFLPQGHWTGVAEDAFPKDTGFAVADTGFGDTKPDTSTFPDGVADVGFSG